MIKSEKEYLRAMRKMIRSILQGNYKLSSPPSREELEVLSECIEQGYLLSQYSKEGKKVLRTLDGTPHPRVETSTVPLKGLQFLAPDRTKLKANIAIVLSVLALLVSLMASLDEIIANLYFLADLLG